MRYITFISLFILAFSACENKTENKIEKIEVKKVQNVNNEALHIIKQYYSNRLADSLLIIDSDTIFTFVFFEKIRESKSLIFSNKGHITPLGDSLYSIIKNSRRYGLVPDEYRFHFLEKLKENFYDQKEDLYNVSNIAAFEVYLTDAYIRFGAHLNKGRFNPDTLLLEWNPEKLDPNWVSILTYGIKNNEISKAFDSLEPKHMGYKFLKKAMANYISENETLNWDSISFLNINDTVKFRQALKVHFINTGDYNDKPILNDSLKLALAIKSFQKKFNLEQDGKLRKYTKQALGLSKEYTIRQMEMALERWRWEPVKYPDKYAVVNIPSAEINVWERDKKKKVDTLVLNSKVVVGKPENQTPILSSKINYMLIYPYWNVPFNIAWKEILPMVQKDTNYIHKHNFEVVNGRGEVVSDLSKLRWKKYNKDYLPVRFRQRIGNDNSLGVCKFNFNNKYGVYLHDTNSKRYFKTFYRYQSHGCIRIEKYIDLARFLIREDTLKIPYDTLNVYFGRQEQKKINLRKPLPIYVRYFTAGADSNLLLQLNLDVYKLDQQMIKMTYKK